jgi:PAS domain S-box-containing protein
VFVVDASQRIILWNKGAERLLGYSASEVLGEPCHQIIAGKCDGKMWCHADCRVQRELRRRGWPSDFDLLTHTRDGREIWLNISILAVPAHGTPLAAHFMRDVTRDKQNEGKLANILPLLLAGGPAGDKKTGSQPSARTLPLSLRPPNPATLLTRREVEVLTLLAKGDAGSAIAERMGISLLTVRKHMQNALRRLGLHSRAAAVSFAFRNGLL